MNTSAFKFLLIHSLSFDTTGPKQLVSQVQIWNKFLNVTCMYNVLIGENYKNLFINQSMQLFVQMEKLV